MIAGGAAAAAAARGASAARYSTVLMMGLRTPPLPSSSLSKCSWCPGHRQQGVHNQCRRLQLQVPLLPGSEPTHLMGGACNVPTAQQTAPLPQQGSTSWLQTARAVPAAASCCAAPPAASSTPSHKPRCRGSHDPLAHVHPLTPPAGSTCRRSSPPSHNCAPARRAPLAQSHAACAAAVQAAAHCLLQQ